MQNLKKETDAAAGGRCANNYPTDHYPSNNYPTDHRPADNAKDSSRYSRPDKRPDRSGPGGEN